MNEKAARALRRAAARYADVEVTRRLASATGDVSVPQREAEVSKLRAQARAEGRELYRRADHRLRGALRRAWERVL